MVELIGSLSQFKKAKILVLGDLMLDCYTMGKVRRVSPEAPVAVLKADSQENRPGGAGNVALSIQALGSESYLLGRVGKDASSKILTEKLLDAGVGVSNLFEDPFYRLPVKHRFLADGQQLMRVDHETIEDASALCESWVIDKIKKLLPLVDLVAVSDYGKGFLSKKILQETILLAKKLNCPVIIDPKGHDYSKYAGATLIKPNLKEAYLSVAMEETASLDSVAAALFKQVDVEKVLVTRAQDGMTLYTKEAIQHFAIPPSEVRDVTGAGDTVLATLSVAIANGITMEKSIHFANVSAGVAIRKIGCAQVGLSDMARALLERDCAQKVFDKSHLFALGQLLKESAYYVVVISLLEKMSHELFSSLRFLSENLKGKKMLIQITDEDPDREFVSMLASLREVDFVVIDDEEITFPSLQPECSYFFDGKEMKSFALTT